MKMKLKTKGIIKKIALALAGVAALTAVAFGVKAIVDYTKNDLKKLTLSYDVGNLGTDGKYVADESTLYTKEAFACYGLQIKPDFDSTVNYQIFYYDILDNYISATSVLSDGYSGEAPVNCAYARMVIEPRDDEDGKISLTERVKYPSQLTVKVYKEQKINERFGVYKGRVLGVVLDTDSLVFTKGLTLFHQTMDWNERSNYSATTTCILKVNGGSTLNYDISKLGSGYDSYCRVYQFKDMPLDENIMLFDEYVMTSTSLVLDKKAKYIILTVELKSQSTSWTDSVVSKLPTCFSITKTK